MAQRFTKKRLSSSKTNLVEDVRAAIKAVVRIHARGFNENESRTILDPRFVVPEEWTGTGFFIRLRGKDGYILTNGHVARNSRSLEIKSIMTSDEFFKVEIVGLVDDLEPDVALLTFAKGEKERFIKLSKEKSIPCLVPAYQQEIKRGEEVKTIGYPLGMSEPHISGGELSNFIAGTDTTVERMVTDAAINFGNSGGPAVIRGAKVVGINTAIIAGAENIGFITPVHLVENALDLFLDNKPAGLFKLGALFQKNSAVNASKMGLKTPVGVIVIRVTPGSPAESLGLKPLDVVLEVNRHKLDRHGNVLGERNVRKRNLFDLLHKVGLGEEFSLRVFRDGQLLTLKGPAFLWKDDSIPTCPVLSKRRYMFFGGMIFQEMSVEILDALEGIGFDRDPVCREYYRWGSSLIVTHIGAGTPAEEAGLYLGDFLVSVEDKKVRNLDDLKNALAQARIHRKKQVLLHFSSGAIAYLDVKRLTPADSMVRSCGRQKSYGI